MREAVLSWMGSTAKRLKPSADRLQSGSKPTPSYIVQRTGGGYNFVASQPLVSRLVRSPSSSPKKRQPADEVCLPHSSICASVSALQICRVSRQ